jgi:hypothetical protein
MLDDDDLDFAVLASSGSGGWLGAILGLVVVVVVWYFVDQNKTECASLHCDRGTPQLMNHQCLCAEQAK